MQSEDNDDGGPALAQEADDAMRKLFRFILMAFIKDQYMVFPAAA